jgi:hypothetical protein
MQFGAPDRGAPQENLNTPRQTAVGQQQKWREAHSLTWHLDRVRGCVADSDAEQREHFGDLPEHARILRRK